MAGDPARFQFSNWQARRERAVPSFLVSLTIHIVVAAVAWNVNPRPEGRVFRAPTITQILAEENQQIVWYSPKAELPKIAPARQQESAPERPPRYEAPQRISANAPDAASERQTIVGESPEIRIEQDQALPNMLSWTAPKVEMPRYQLVAPPRAKPPEPVKIVPERAPELPLEVAPAVDVSKLSQIARLRYEARRKDAAPPPETKIEVEPAPEIRAEAAPSVDPAQMTAIARLRYQQQQQAREAPRAQALQAEQAPEIRTGDAPVVDPSRLTGIARLRYQQQQQQREAPRAQALAPDDAPALRAVPGQPGLDPTQFQEVARLRYQSGDRGQAEPAPARQALGAVAEAPAPDIAGVPSASAGALPVAADVPRLRYQGQSEASPASAPSARSVGEIAGQPAPEVGGAVATSGPLLTADLPSVAPPPPSLGAEGTAAGGTGGERNLAVVGVNPADRVPNELPRGSRAGAFSAGPKAAPDGGPSAPKGDPSASLRLPDVAVEAPSADPAEAVRRLTRGGGFEQMRPQARREIGAGPTPIKIDPDLPFAGRAVYTLAINMPNVTSYRGDWVLQFAEALPPGARAGETPEEREKRLAQRDDSLTPPYPSVKVDPKYAAEAVRERIEGEVVLYAIIRETGELTNLTLVKGVDERLDASARAAISKWRFEPARKLGAPVAVEALVRIPFRLNPGVRVRY